MVAPKELNSPAEEGLISPTVEQMERMADENDGKVRLKKQLGLLEGVAIILGIIFGSGNSFKFYYIICTF